MISLPLGTAAVVVVREDLMIVNVTTGEQRAPAWTAHGSGHVRVSQLGALVPYSLQSPWHKVQRTCNRYETTILDTIKHTTTRFIYVCQNTFIVPQSFNRVGFNMLFIALNTNVLLVLISQNKYTVFTCGLYNSYLKWLAFHNKNTQCDSKTISAIFLIF